MAGVLVMIALGTDVARGSCFTGVAKLLQSAPLPVTSDNVR
jgi:hypothetical protein